MVIVVANRRVASGLTVEASTPQRRAQLTNTRTMRACIDVFAEPIADKPERIRGSRPR